MSAKAPSKLLALNSRHDELEIVNKFSTAFWAHVQAQLEVGENVTVALTLRHRDTTEEFRADGVITEVIVNDFGDAWWFKIGHDPELYGSYVNMTTPGPLQCGHIRGKPFDVQKSQM